MRRRWQIWGPRQRTETKKQMGPAREQRKLLRQKRFRRRRSRRFDRKRRREPKTPSSSWRPRSRRQKEGADTRKMQKRFESLTAQQRHWDRQKDPARTIAGRASWPGW